MGMAMDLFEALPLVWEMLKELDPLAVLFRRDGEGGHRHLSAAPLLLPVYRLLLACCEAGVPQIVTHWAEIMDLVRTAAPLHEGSLPVSLEA
jgi:hypothetical protein